MSNGQNIIRRLHGAADIALRSGEHLLIGRPAVFGAEFREMIEGHKPALTERVILNIQDYASHGMGRLHGVLADYDGWGGLPLSASGISQRVAGLVRRGSLLALIIPAVTLNDMTTDSAQLEAMSADLARQEGVNPELSVEGKTFADLNGMTDKLVYVIKSSGQYFSFESVKTAFTSAMTVTAIISVAVVLAAWAASHFAGIGFAIDAVLIAIGWIMLGWAIFSAMRSLLKCLKLIHHAESLEDLDKAAKMFADAVTQFGVDVIIGLLTRGAGKMRARANAKGDGAGGSASTTPRSRADIEAENRARADGGKKKGEEKKKAEQTALIAGRKKIARDFYRKQGWSDSKIDDHMAGIDFNKPVEIVTLKKGEILGQWQSPGAPKGNYFAPANETPSKLGIGTVGFNRSTGNAESKLQKIYQLDDDLEVLSSKAKAILDDWSNPYAVAQTTGGGQQYFVPDIAKFIPYP